LSSSADSNQIAVGRLIRARGNRGELLGEIYSSRPGRADQLKQVTLELNGRKWAAEIEQVWMHDGRPVFKFAGIDSISDAEPWAGADILVPAEERIVPEEGEYSFQDLIGSEVVDRGNPVGIVRGIEEFGSAPLLKVEGANGREILIPFAKSICREIDIAGKKIRVELPEGLLDL
jgi:16S rRNA processing protein RimM